jgi:hypothetical protein
VSFSDFEGRLKSSFALFAVAFFSFRVTTKDGLVGFCSSSNRTDGAATIVFLAPPCESEGWLETVLEGTGFRSLLANASSTIGGRVGESKGGNLTFFSFLVEGGGSAFCDFGAFSTAFFLGLLCFPASSSNNEGWSGDNNSGRDDFDVSGFRGVEVPLSDRIRDPFTWIVDLGEEEFSRFLSSDDGASPLVVGCNVSLLISLGGFPFVPSRLRGDSGTRRRA